MPVITAAQRKQGDIETICEQAKDDVDAALWHYSRSPGLAASEIETAILDLQTALQLIRDQP
jgi:hypothetical protein